MSETGSRQGRLFHGLVVVVAAMALLVSGCRAPVAQPPPADPPPLPLSDASKTWILRERLTPVTAWTEPAAGVLGFVAASPWPVTGHTTLRLGWWNLETGDVTFDPEPLLVLEDPSPVPYLWLSWDPRHGVLYLVVAREAEVSSVRSDLSLVVVSPPVAAPPAGAIATGGDVGTLVLTHTTLEVLREPGRGPAASYPLERPGRPLSLRPRDASVEALLCLASQPGSDSLSAALLTLVNEGLALQALSPPLPISEAGAGTRWARVGNHVYAATPAGEVWTWEPGTDPARNEAITGLVAAYRREHALVVESLQPPVLFGWDDLLVILDRPEAMEESRNASGQVVGRTAVSTWYAVVVRGEVILGELVGRNGQLAICRNGVNLATVTLPEGYDCLWWFPGQSSPP